MNTWLICIIYMALLSVRVIAPDFLSISMLTMIMMNGCIYIADKNKADMALLSSFLMPGEIYPTLNLIVGLILRIRINPFLTHIKMNKISVVCGGLIVITSIFNAINYNTFWNVLFYGAYLMMIIFTLHMSNKTINTSQYIVEILKKFVLIEFGITILIMFKTKSYMPGDMFSGTLNSAHWFGNWLIVMLIVLCFYDDTSYDIKISKRAIKENLMYLILVFAMLYLADAKSLVMSLALAVIAFIVFERKTTRKYSIVLFVFSFYAFLFGLFFILYNDVIRELIEKHSQLLQTYLYADGWNGKFEYIRGTLLEELSGIRILFGYGIGQYGSRVSNLFAYDIMWRASNGINNMVATLFKSYYIPQFAKYMEYYDASFVSQIAYRSAVLSYPFNNVLTLIAETGIIGMIFWSNLLNKHIRNSKCKILIYYFAIACFFDMYFDNFPCVALIIVVMNFLMNSSNKIKNT